MLNIIQLSRNIRTIRRYRHIIRVLIKYGFDHLLEYMNLSHIVARSRKLLPAFALLSNVRYVNTSSMSA